MDSHSELFDFLPQFNTLNNLAALILVLLALKAVREKQVQRHKLLMLAAMGASASFLTGYLAYHFLGTPRKYEGAWPSIYYPMLVSHVVLAVFVPPGVIYVVRKALQGDLARHRAVARYVAAVWCYVSLTGVLVYLFVHGL